MSSEPSSPPYVPGELPSPTPAAVPSSPPDATMPPAFVPRTWLPGVDDDDDDDESDFSMANFPFGIFSSPGRRIENERPRAAEETGDGVGTSDCDADADANGPRCGSALGRYVIDLSALAEAGIFDVPYGDDEVITFPGARHIFASSTLNGFMSKPRKVWTAVRRTLIGLFVDGGPDDRLRCNPALRARALIPLDQVIMHLPASIGDYTDFYSSREHATNVGIMFRGVDNALQPNWLHLPVAYHGRASSVFVSGTDVVRPRGQLQADPADPGMGSVHGPSRLLDFELEVAFFVGGEPNAPGDPVCMSDADERIFGFVLMNDWSARDVQKWEYVPLGPFCGKNFATSISPWVVTVDALEPYRRPTSASTSNGGMGQTDPMPLDYLRDPNYSSYDINLEVCIRGAGMSKPERVTFTNYSHLYWTPRQQLVHHSSTGCVMKPGDLLASGTISGTDFGSYGSMLELSWKGTREVRLGDKDAKDDDDDGLCRTRKFLLDGDEVIMTGWCEKKSKGGRRRGRVGFGMCSGKVLPAGSKLMPGPAIGSWVQAEG